MELPGFLFAAQLMSAKLLLARAQQLVPFYPSLSGLIKFHSFKPHTQPPGKSNIYISKRPQTAKKYLCPSIYLKCGSDEEMEVLKVGIG